ncbi:Hypothetical protein CINCED_3A008361 [Cinara cedri]|uniref:Uncharacterized protein n=1 Tax=Cinara cedri TaxID=506608 RepID=A0A5E4N431_9HEMI|nr:Hypothetical protein CINCED_3A008361 [Cinara cedri]
MEASENNKGSSRSRRRGKGCYHQTRYGVRNETSRSQAIGVLLTEDHCSEDNLSSE